MGPVKTLRDSFRIILEDKKHPPSLYWPLYLLGVVLYHLPWVLDLPHYFFLGEDLF